MTERRAPDGRSHRRGRARLQVLDALTSAQRPLSAEEVAQLVPDVHVSSVYRSLAALEAEGVIAHLHLGHGPSIYRLTADTSTDGHVVCEVCGRHDVVPEAEFAALATSLRERHGFHLDTSHFAVVGRCDRCQRAGAAAPQRHTRAHSH